MLLKKVHYINIISTFSCELTSHIWGNTPSVPVRNTLQSVEVAGDALVGVAAQHAVDGAGVAVVGRQALLGLVGVAA